MRAQNVAPVARQSRPADVDMPQARPLGIFPCYSRHLWAIVHVDQSQVVYPSERGSAQCTALEKNRSRGCRALRSPFLHCAWLRSLQLVQSLPKKLFTWMNQPSPPNPSTPANTSNHQGRAPRAHARPALFLSAPPASAGYYRPLVFNFACADRANYGADSRNDNNWRPSCGQHLSLPFFLSPWLQPVQNPHQSQCPSKNRLRLSLPQPANTSDLKRFATNLLQIGCKPRLTSAGPVAFCISFGDPSKMQNAVTGRAGSYRPAPFARRKDVKVRLC